MTNIPKVHEIAKEFERLQNFWGQVLWAQYTTGLDFGLDDAQKKRREFLSDKGHFKTICDARDTDLSPDDRRAVDIVYNTFGEYHLSDRANTLRTEIDALVSKLSDINNKHRTEYLGREISSTEWGRLVTESEDREVRKSAFLARRNINRRLFDAGFLKLIELRKEFAAATGSTDFVTYSLEKDELEPGLFDTWKDEIRSRKHILADRKRELAQRHLGTEELKPWDMALIKNKACAYNSAKVDMAEFQKPLAKTFRAYGFDIEKMNLTYDVFPRKNKSEWGYNFTLKTGVDSRVLANVDDRFSSYWVLLHETAHGVHFLGLDPEESAYNSAVSGIVAEGFANFFGDLAYSREFLGAVFPGDVEPIVRSFEEVKRITDMRTLSSLATTIFDHELYRAKLTTLDDIHELYWKTEFDLLGEKPYADEPLWAHVIHHTSAPIYLHNYFLGDVMCENMKDLFHRRTGSAASASPLQFGTFWKERVLKPSGRYSFLDLYEKVCEEKLSISKYLDKSIRG